MRHSLAFLACVLLSSTHVAAEEPTGRPVNGLEVTLTVAETSWTVGGVLNVTATVRNVGERPFLIDTFGELDGLYRGKHASQTIASCWVLVWDHQPSPEGPRGMPAVLAPEQFVRLAPGALYAKHLSVPLNRVVPGQYHIRLAYAPRAASPSFSFPEHWEDQHRLSGPMWLGMAFSNALTVDVVTATPSPDLKQHAPRRQTDL